MQIQVRARHVVVPPRFAQEVEHRMRVAIGRFARRVHRVALRFSDLNGPRGGVDKACVVTVSLSKAGTLRYRAVAGDVVAAMFRAVAGTQEAVVRRLGLRRDGPRHDGRQSRSLAWDVAPRGA